MPPSYCDQHTDENLKLFCFDGKSAICMMCHIELHSNHKCSDVNKVDGDFRKIMASDVDNVAAGVEKCREMLESLEMEKNGFSEQVTKTGIEISVKAEQLKRMIDVHREKLMNGLHDRADELLMFDVIECMLADHRRPQPSFLPLSAVRLLFKLVRSILQHINCCRKLHSVCRVQTCQQCHRSGQATLLDHLQVHLQDPVLVLIGLPISRYHISLQTLLISLMSFEREVHKGI